MTFKPVRTTTAWEIYVMPQARASTWNTRTVLTILPQRPTEDVIKQFAMQQKIARGDLRVGAVHFIETAKGFQRVSATPTREHLFHPDLITKIRQTQTQGEEFDATRQEGESCSSTYAQAHDGSVHAGSA